MTTKDEGQKKKKTEIKSVIIYLSKTFVERTEKFQSNDLVNALRCDIHEISTLRDIFTYILYA